MRWFDYPVRAVTTIWSKVRKVRIADVWWPPDFADAMNDRFGGPHRSSASARECSLRAETNRELALRERLLQ